MSYERFTDGVFETKWRPGAQPEFHRGEYKQRPLVEEKNEADRINQINIELLNMPIIAAVLPELKPVEKPEPKNLESGLTFLDVIEMMLEMIVEGFKAILPKGKWGTNIP